MANEEEDHALVDDEETPTEFALMAKTSVDSQNKEGLGYSAVPPPSQVYSPPKKDLSWTRLPKFTDDTVTDYSRPSPAIETDRLTEDKTDKVEIAKKPTIKYAEFYRKTTKRVDHLSYNRGKWVDHGSSWAKNNNTHKSKTPRIVFYKTGRPPIRTNRPYMNATQPKRTSFYKPAHSYSKRHFQRTSAVRSQFRGPRVATVNRKSPTVNRKFPTVNRKFPTGNTKFSTTDMGNKGKAIKASACWIWKPTQNLSNKGPNSNCGKSQNHIGNKGYWDSGCSRHMTGNISYLSDYESLMEDMCLLGKVDARLLAKEQSKLNNVLFTDSECIVLGRDFKLTDDTNVLLRTPRQHNMYTIDLNNIVLHRDLTCLVAKASVDECMLWHRRPGHLNFKTMNKLVRHNLVRGLPTKCFENDHNCTACLKGKQHKASCKTKLVNSMTKPLHTLHMDLFGPTCDETSGILRNFITEIENLKELKVKIIRCDNGGEFRNKEVNDFCLKKGIKREFSNARTPQQNKVAERRNRTLIEAARTMLADAKLPVTFWAEAVNTACYVQNRVLVNKSQNKTPYELFNGITPAIGFLKPFSCHVMILNILDNLGKFKTKGDECYFIGYSMSSKAFRVHDALLESSSSKPHDGCILKVPKGSGNTNPTASTSNPPAAQMETLTVEIPILT
nr:hypothetical protein [Tanacetum cinerariifolium]